MRYEVAVAGNVTSIRAAKMRSFDYAAFNAQQNALLEKEERTQELRRNKAAAIQRRRQKRIGKLTKELTRLDCLWQSGQKTLELFCEMDAIEEELLTLA